MNLLSNLCALSGVSAPPDRLELCRPYAEAQHPPTQLDGQYRLSATGIHAEIELVEAQSKRRSLVYIRDGQEIVLFIRPGVYDLFFRFLSPPGVYAAQITLIRMGIVARARFACAKLAALLRRPPTDWLSVAQRLLRPSPQDITGATLDSATRAAPTTDIVRISEPPGSSDPDSAVSIIIPTKTQTEMLIACVASLDRSPVTHELIIVDNGATDPGMIACLAKLSLRPDVLVLHHDVPFNFAELCNIGARRARYPTLLFLNDDVEAQDDTWLGTLQAYLARSDVGVVGARLLYPDGALQHAGVAVNLVPGPGHPWRGVPQSDWSRPDWNGHSLVSTAGDVDAVTGACLMIDRELFQRLGGFDEDAFAVTLNDVDLCLKVRARGLKVLYVPQATLVHKESRSRRRDDHPAERQRREAELKAFYGRYGDLARHSVFLPPDRRRDTDTGARI